MSSPLVNFTADFISGAGRLVLQPVIPASALVFLAYGRPDLVKHVTDLQIVKDIGLDTVKKVFKVILALGIGNTINGFLNRVALNGWRIRSHAGWIWTQEIAVVTGGCNGIGKTIVLGLTAKGVRVAILDIANLPEDLAQNDRVSYWKCDISSPEAVAEAAEAVRKTLGHPSILINNAGVAHTKSIMDVSHKELKNILGINLHALWITAKEFLPNMILKNKGHIVTIASGASYVVLPKEVDYSATKAGAMAFYEGLTSELKNIYKSTGIMTSLVHPFYVNTNMIAGIHQKVQKSIGSVLEPEDVGKIVVKQVFQCRGGHLFAPSSISYISMIRSLPTWTQEIYRDMFAKLLSDKR